MQFCCNGEPNSTYRTGGLTHVNLAFQIKNWATGKSERLQVRVKGYVFHIVSVVGASEGAYEAFVDHATDER